MSRIESETYSYDQYGVMIRDAAALRLLPRNAATIDMPIISAGFRLGNMVVDIEVEKIDDPTVWVDITEYFQKNTVISTAVGVGLQSGEVLDYSFGAPYETVRSIDDLVCLFDKMPQADVFAPLEENITGMATVEKLAEILKIIINIDSPSNHTGSAE